ncbi:MAG: ribbon-helix-helix protein, CopG family [Candidatus Aminicenantes bacterium]|nr:ribbon-helix-helix protein, CopG family [Candidatus Aminicenantes bacterium]
MPQTTTITVRLPVEDKNRLDSLAIATERSRAYLAAKAIEEYLNLQEWQIQAIQEAVREADSPNAEFVEHDEIVGRVKKMVKK